MEVIIRSIVGGSSLASWSGESGENAVLYIEYKFTHALAIGGRQY